MNQKRKLYWIVTNVCNLACQYCYYRTGLEERIPGKFNASKALSLINQFPDFFNEIIFTGGEPLLIPSLFKLIKQCKNKGLRVGILTNGILLNKVNCQKISDLYIDFVSISLDSSSQEINDPLRGKTHLVLQGIKNILTFKQKSTTVEMMQTITKKNIFSIRPLVQFCQENNINLWLNPVDVGNNKSLAREIGLQSCSPNELLMLEKEMYCWARVMKNKALKKFVENCLFLIKNKKPRGISCSMGTSHFVLDVNGNMYPCFLRKDIYLGNIYKEKLKTIMNKNKLKSHQSSLRTAKCARLGCMCMTIAGKY